MTRPRHHLTVHTPGGDNAPRNRPDRPADSRTLSRPPSLAPATNTALTRTWITARALSTAAIVALVANGCGASSRSRQAPTPQATTTVAGRNTTTTSSSEHASAASTTSSAQRTRLRLVVGAFAAAYARYLDADLPASALPAITPSAEAETGPPLPPSLRAGHPTVASIAAAARPLTFTIALRDDAHTFKAHITATSEQSQWRITQIDPPNVEQVVPQHVVPIPPPPGSAAPAQAARAFLSDYLAWLYGHAAANAIVDATPALVEQLKQNPPEVPPTFRSLHATVTAIPIQRRGSGWQALPDITDGRETHELALTLTQTHGKWLISSIGSPP